MSLSRRSFLRSSAYLSLGFAGLRNYACTRTSRVAVAGATDSIDYGPLLRDEVGVVDLPAGFNYQVISRRGDPMNDGLLVPGAADGMGTFSAPDDRVIIVRNHELSPTQGDQGPFLPGTVHDSGVSPNDFYDFGSGRMPALGGTSTLVFNETTGRVEKQFASLLGTIRNCAGGITPWGTWLTCEEDLTLKGSHEDAMEQDHGFVFEVPATTEATRARPIPITAMGRFNHEAVAVDPVSGIVYLTEDRHDGLLYRFIPNVKQRLLEGGRLQALAVADQNSFDTRNWPENESSMVMSQDYRVDWIDVENVLSPDDDLRHQGSSKGAAVFARGEGIWFGNGEFFFACTSGGRNKKGQLFKLTPTADGDVLELFIEPNDTEIMKSCDNLTIARDGYVFLCEDDVDAYIRGVTPSGEVFTFAHNTGYRSEFAGICFSPSGKTMFVNIQGPGLTLAITGAWKHLNNAAPVTNRSQ